MSAEPFSPEGLADAFANWVADEDISADADTIRLMSRAFAAGCVHGVRWTR